MAWKIKFKPRPETKYKLWPRTHANKYTANRRVRKLKKAGFDAYTYKAKMRKKK